MWSFFSRDPTKDFPYEIESTQYESSRVIWSIHKGKKKGTNEDVTVFILNSKAASPTEIDLAKSAVKRLKTLRHPNILSYLDSVESDKGIYLATEYCIPLEKHLESKENLNGDLSISWGIFQVTRGLSFLINDGNLRHNNVQLGSVFVNSAGEWKLGGVEFITGTESPPVSGKLPSILHKFDPPELKSGGNFGKTKWSIDSYGLACLVWEVFNGQLQNEASLKSSNKIPKHFVSIFNELIHNNSATRPNPCDIIVKCRRPGGFFKNDLIDSLLFLEEIQIKEQNEKTKFFTGLPSVLDKFPDDICRFKILPQLVNAFEFGSAGSAILSPLFKLGKLLDEAEYQAKIVPCVVKLFSSTDRATRVRLLQQLENFADHLLPNTVNEKIFPNIVTGYLDTNPTVREQSVKAMLYLAPKLNDNNLNVELLKHFARLQIRDDQPGIRTNTTICLGKIACHLNPQTRRKVLIPAFTRVFSDQFPQARIAGILGLAATQQYYLLSEVSTRILPALCSLTSDQDKSVRDNAFKTIKGFLNKLEKVSEDPALREKYDAENETATASNTAATWAGWAVSSLTSKFNRSQSQQSILGQGQVGTGRPKGRYPFGNQSSSSTSTTTSSIPSTPSGERDILETTAEEHEESTTDYENDWDADDWGSIDENDRMAGNKESFDKNESSLPGPSSSSMSSKKYSSHQNNRSDDWDKVDSWANDNGWADNDDLVLGDGDQKQDTDWDIGGQSGENNPYTTNSINKTSLLKAQESSDWGSSTENTEKTLTPSSSSDLAKQEEMRNRRDERKLHRQSELEAKKSTKSGPLKLGAKKIQMD